MLWQPAYMHKLNFDRNNFLLEIIKIKGQAQTLMNMLPIVSVVIQRMKCL